MKTSNIKAIKKQSATLTKVQQSLDSLDTKLARFIGKTTNAVRFLDEQRQVQGGHGEQVATMLGTTQIVVAAVVEALGIEDKVREIVARVVAETEAKHAADQAAIANAPAVEIPEGLVDAAEFDPAGNA